VFQAIQESDERKGAYIQIFQKLGTQEIFHKLGTQEVNQGADKSNNSGIFLQIYKCFLHTYFFTIVYVGN
jgi:hypothetical protein